MEDSHTVHAYLPPGSATPSKTDTSIPEQPQGSTVTNNDDGTDGNALFGVFDGHGGSSVAKFAGTTMHTRLAGLDEYCTFRSRSWRCMPKERVASALADRAKLRREGWMS